MMCDKEEWADDAGYELVNNSVEDTIHEILLNNNTSVKSIKPIDDDVDDYAQPYKCWYVQQNGGNSDAMFFRLYADNSWVCVWS